MNKLTADDVRRLYAEEGASSMLFRNDAEEAADHVNSFGVSFTEAERLVRGYAREELRVSEADGNAAREFEMAAYGTD
ncbi:hypothetical protein OIV36_31495 [Burkholderia pseudomallei]|uniref:hypothetical protein n=1 Tax=Burkholderia pseudomallei TaxID=28450 RepID=UPI0021F76796|nr:hypothetical protein [Burkholderia pseudomallei]MCW0053995.1 hypothetical protein [Burkholderia pseudomallei]